MGDTLNVPPHSSDDSLSVANAPVREVITWRSPGVPSPTAQAIFTANRKVEVVSAVARFGVTSTSGTLNLLKASSATAISSGTAVLASTMSLSGTADTNVTGTLATAIADRVLTSGQTLGCNFAGTLTGLSGFVVTVVLKYIN